MEGYQFTDMSLTEFVDRLKTINSRIAKNIEDLNAQHCNQLASLEQLGCVGAMPSNGQKVNSAPTTPEPSTVYGMLTQEINKLFDYNHYFTSQTDDARFISEALYRQTPNGAPAKDQATVDSMQQMQQMTQVR